MNPALFSTSEYWTWLGVSSIASIAGILLAFRWLLRARIIEDTPTALIRSAHQGYVELSGQARMMDGMPITAPLTGTACCWYRYRIEKKGDKNWRTLESDTSDGLFLLQDETGECIIDPEGAEVTPGSRSVWYGTTRYPQQRNPASVQVGHEPLFRIESHTRQNFSFGSRYRYTEERIHDMTPLYTLGLFKSRDELDRQQDQKEMTRSLLQAWKQDKAALLSRFDLNNDGQIDVQEWELARKTATNQARHGMIETPSQQLNRLVAPDERRQPFLLSTLPQFDLVRRYRLMAAGGLVLFFAGGATAVWIVTHHAAG